MTVLNHALLSITNQLNAYLENFFNLCEPCVVCSNLSQADGTQEVGTSDKIVATLVNVAPEATISYNNFQGHAGGELGRRAPPIDLNIHILFTANFAGARYLEGLKFLSLTIQFFQQTPVFTRPHFPDLDPCLEKLSLEMMTMSPEDLYSIMAAQKTRYLPSVLYKMRGVVVQDALNSAKPISSAPPIDG